MNESNEFLSDEMLNDLLSPFRDLTVPEETRAANQAAVKLALAASVRPAWWRRSVAVPLPAAIAAAAVLAIAVPASLWPSRGPSAIHQAITPSNPPRLAERAGPSHGGEEKALRSDWSATRSYIQTLGALGGGGQTFEFQTKDDRDDS